MDHVLKRAISLVLALVMVLSLVPSFGHVHAHAEEVEQETTATESTEAAVTGAPTVSETTEPESSSGEDYASIQKWIDEILTWYLGSTEATQEQIEAAVAEMTADDVWMTQVEIEDLFAEAQATLSEAELNALVDNNEVFLAFHDELAKQPAHPNMLAAISGHADTTIGLSGTTSRWTVGANSLTGSVTGIEIGSYYFSASETLTITNNKDTAATLSFDFTASGNFAVGSSVTVDGTEYTAATTSTFSKELTAGGSITIKLAADRCNASYGANTISIAITNLSLAADGTYTTTFEAPDYGSYTVAYGSTTETISAGDASVAIENASSVQYTMTVTPGTGNKLVGWYNVTTGTYLSTDATYVAQFDSNSTIKPIVVPSDTAVFMVDNTYFTDLDDAVNYATANSQTQITLVDSGTISDASYTIPAGITLLIPKDTDYSPMGIYVPTNILYASSAMPEATTATTAPYAFLTLTLASGTTVNVEGVIEAEAAHTTLQGSAARVYGGRVCGAYGAIKMSANSQIVLNSGSTLYAWGYVYGDGEVIANSGATVYEYIQFTDFAGGGNLSGFVDTALDADANGDGIYDNDYIKSFPFSQYYVQNIEAPLTIHVGAIEYVYTTLTVSSQNVGMPIEFIGANGLFQPGTGSITKDYDHTTDRLVVDVNGNSALKSIVLDMSQTAYGGIVSGVIGTDSFDSSKYILGLNSNITINVNSGTTTVGQDVALFPGVEVYVDYGATMVIAEGESLNLTVYGTGGHNVYAYDLENWGNYVFQGVKMTPASYSPTPGRYQRTASDLKDVIIDVNGTIIANGYLYTTVTMDEETWLPISGGAAIISSQKTGTIVMQNGAGAEEFAYRLDGTSAADDVVTIASAWLKNGDGTFLQTAGAEAGTTYNYCATHDQWYTGECADCAVSTYEITWIGATTDLGTEEYKEGEVPSYKGTTPTKAQSGCTTYTFAGWSTKANGEGTKYPVGTALPAATGDAAYYAYFTEGTSHTAGTAVTENEVAADCDTEGSYDTVVYCSVCNAELSRKTTTVDALGHSYDSGVVTTDPTCTAEGVKTYTCATCGDTYTEAVSSLGHTEGEAVKENEVAADCDTEGSYDTVVYCSVCDAELSRETTTVDALGHTEGEAVKENEVAADCDTEGSYDTVVYCTVCDAELSRETTTVPALGHTEGEAVTENEVAATCGADGSYDTVVYCSVCDAELSRVTTTVPATGAHVYATESERVEATCTVDGYVIMACGCGATEKTTLAASGHTEGEVVVEDEVDATCTTEGSYCNVVYCSVCGEELSHDTIVVPALGHTDGEPVTENEVAADCENDGSYDTVIYCTVCGEETSRVTTTVPASGHTDGEAVTENEVDATCTADGSYDTVVYCTVCDAELSRETTTVPALGHTDGEPVTENEVDATCTADGSYDTVIYCTVCDAELSRETTTVDALGHDYVESAAQWYVIGEDYYYGTVSVCGNDDTHVIYNPVTGLTRVPYPTEEINGVTYGPDAETLAYYESKGKTFVDATEAWFLFAEDGKFQFTTTGMGTYLEATRWMENGMLTWHPGVVQIEDEYYYFIGDETNGGNILAAPVVAASDPCSESNGYTDIYVTRVHSSVTGREFVIGGIYSFEMYTGDLAEMYGFRYYINENDERVIRYHGTDGADKYRLHVGDGLIEIDGSYYYVRSNGELVVNADYYLTEADFEGVGLELKAGVYAFDENGNLIIPELDPVKDGIYYEDGAWVYYEDGVIGYNKGLISVTENWINGETTESKTGVIYVRSNGKLATGEYYITNVANYTGTDVASGSKVKFNEYGIMDAAKNGIVAENGSLYYYVNNQIAYAAGLIEIDGSYYYVRSNGEVVHGRNYWITNVNETGVVAKQYTFDDNGVLQNPEFSVKNGIIDGYYYVDGKIAYAAGLIEIETGKYIYVRSNGQLATGKYWTTNTNDLLPAAQYDFGTDGILVIE